MKRLRLIWAMSLAFGLLLVAAGCKKDKKMVLVPELTTTAFTAVDNTSGATGGTVTSDGGAELTSVGVYYSKTNPTPGSSDTKLEGSLTGGAFTVQLTGLSTGSTYYVRAYATNSAGTGYGQVLSFMTGNSAPVATEVKINGEIGIGKVLTAAYSYSDSESDPESGTSFQWYSAKDAAGAEEAAIAGATASTYTTVATDEFKFIRVGVTPKSSAGTTAGAEVKSAFVGPLPEAGETVTFMYNGKSVTYGVIESPVTHRKWLDRNLGAPNAPTSFDDWENYGDLFQWGRRADGHQLVIRGADNASTKPAGDNISTMEDESVTTTLSTTDIPGNDKFIIGSFEQSEWDWRNPSNLNMWNGSNDGGTNNPCPSGYRVPTQEEWAAEVVGISTGNEGFNKLKLTLCGSRNCDGSAIFATTSRGWYWTSSLYTDDPTVKYIMYVFEIRSTSAKATYTDRRGSAYAVRCIKNP